MSSDTRYPKWKNNQTPKKWFKRHHNRQWKSIFKQQLNRWRKNNEFEIIEQSYSNSAKWEWN